MHHVAQNQMHTQAQQQFASVRQQQQMQMLQPMMQQPGAVRFADQSTTMLYSRPPATPVMIPQTPAPVQQPPSQPAPVTPMSGQAASPNVNIGTPYPSSSPAGAHMMGPSPAYAAETSPVCHPAATPGPKTSQMSPAANSLPPEGIGAEHSPYKEKVNELLVYLEPLKRLIEQTKESTSDSSQTQKFQRMVDILEGRNDTSMDVLLKCEETLKMICQKSDIIKVKDRNINQPLLDAISAITKPERQKINLYEYFNFPLYQCSLKNTCPDCLKGSCENETAQASNVEDSDQISIPLNIQREIGSLESKFRVTIDPSQRPLRSSCKFISVLCELLDITLPSVPPIYIRIPTNYPQSPPKYDLEWSQYCDSPYLNSIRKSLESFSSDTGAPNTISALLTNWETCVRDASFI
ncbi:hypothetical protein D917_01123 [Trichinella nativa]|uniref:Uncharacterized protein n=1 Tax=Trichinella nativa TaxID=6335 RepID=A0A1Y3EV40_9BILA|nr:hypothetical protein D917_01123 [Trichinella nativa]